jgi:ABC-2 type transport system permease protein
MVSALKYAMLGYSEVAMSLALTIVVGLIIILTLINCILIKKGIGLRD